MTKLEMLNKELIKYFTERGWAQAIIFGGFDKNKVLCTSYFSMSNNSKKECNWYDSLDKSELTKYVHWFFEHVRPFWIKYDIGEYVMFCENANKSRNETYYIIISNDGYVRDIVFPSNF